jgi:SPP1 family predicted phage head-tail adaptor
MGLTAAELQYMRETQEGFLPDLCTIRRRTSVPDGRGGTTYANVDTSNVPCRVANQTTKAQSDTAGAERSLYDWMFTFAYGTDVQTADQLLYAGRTIEVQSINTPGSWTTAVRVGGEAIS